MMPLYHLRWRCLTVETCKKVKSHMLTPPVLRSSSHLSPYPPFSSPLLKSTLKVRSCLTLSTFGFKKILLMKLTLAKFGAGVRVVLTKSLKVSMPQLTQVSTAALTALG